MITSDARVRVPRSDAFPPVNRAELPGRMTAALARLDGALRGRDGQADDGGAGRPASP